MARMAMALMCACLALPASVAVAQNALPDPRWRALFGRPAEIPAPADNPLTPERIALGAKLFADTHLSGKGDRSCASCHRPELSFTDGRPRARGHGDAPLKRNTPALWNLAWGKSFSWDGRAPSLEVQVAIPIAAPDEMAGDWAEIVRRLAADTAMVSDFAAAFPREPVVSQATIVKALASYVRSLISPPTRFDAWIEGDAQALSRAETRGFALFTGKGGCVLCHAGWRFTDDRFHDIGLASSDRGQGAAPVPGGGFGAIAFKTPGLREAAHTAPYMHDGSLATLPAVLGHYGGGFRKRPSLAPHMNRALRLSPRERADLLAFLGTLSSEQGPARARQAGPN
jgi:cytochrome c peroxidase